MIYVTRNPLWWLVGTLLSLAIAAVIWFAIVKPQVDHANRTVDETIHNVQPQINHAQKVADCIQTAAGDVDKIASLQSVGTASRVGPGAGAIPLPAPPSS